MFYHRGYVKETMNARCRLIYRGVREGMYYSVDKNTGKRTSLHATNDDAARQVIESMNQVLPKIHWPPVRHQDRRAITAQEHQTIIEREHNPDIRACHQVLCHLGGSQTDIAELSQTFARTPTQRSGQILKTDSLARVRTPPARKRELLEEFDRSGLSGAKFAGLSRLQQENAFLRQKIDALARRVFAFQLAGGLILFAREFARYLDGEGRAVKCANASLEAPFAGCALAATGHVLGWFRLRKRGLLRGHVFSFVGWIKKLGMNNVPQSRCFCSILPGWF